MTSASVGRNWPRVDRVGTTSQFGAHEWFTKRATPPQSVASTVVRQAATLSSRECSTTDRMYVGRPASNSARSRSSAAFRETTAPV